MSICICVHIYSKIPECNNIPAPGVGDGQGGLACCRAWGRKELDTTERLK